MSLFGPRKFDDPRNKLYLSYIRLVEEIQPKAFIIESEPFNSVVTCEMALSDLPSLEDGIGQNVMEYVSDPANAYQALMRENCAQVQNHIAAVHSEKIKHIISLVPDGGNYKSLPDEYKLTRNFHVAWTRFSSIKPAPTFEDSGYDVSYKLLNSVKFGVPQKRERVIIVGFRKDLNIKIDIPEGFIVDENDYTVGAHLAKVSLNSTDPVLQIGEKYRRFTPREVARIQSFPESFQLVESEAAQYRALGNAIPPVMFWYVAKEVANML